MAIDSAGSSRSRDKGQVVGDTQDLTRQFEEDLAERVTADSRHQQRRSAVSFRAVSIGLLCAALLCAITPYNDFKIAATYIAGTQFPIGAVFVLFVLATAVNGALRRVRPRAAFSAGELLTVWTLILVASGLPSSGMMRYFLPEIVAPTGLSTTTNNWQAKIWGDSPSWLFVTDPSAANAFFKGYARGQERIPWEAWQGPLFFWGILAVLFLLATFSIATLLRRQWIQNEKFSFPLVTLPVLLAEEPTGGHLMNDLLRSPLLWISVLLVTALHTVRGLHLLYPSIPDIQINDDLNQYMTVRPWNQLGWIPLRTWPLVIGLAFLLPAEVCFSLWFFFFFFLFERFVCIQNNWLMPGPQGYGDTLFHSLQSYGGGIALVCWVLWTGRQHFADIWEKTIGGPRAREIDDSNEMIPYRWALLGLIVALGGIGLWLTVAGVSWEITAVCLVTLILALVVISWVVCQAGMLFMAQPYGSLDPLTGIFGSGPFKTSSLYTMTRFETMFFYDTREMLAPSVIMGAKTADTAGFSARRLFGAMLASVVIGFGVSLYVSLALPYYNGGGNSLNNPFTYRDSPIRPLNFLAGVAAVPFKGGWINAVHLASGFVGVMGLLILRAQFNFGLHPIGFLCASVYSIKMLWFSIFVGWVCKSLIQRYGGMKGFQSALPFFLGLILGDAINAVIWIVLGYITNVGYAVMPG